MPDSDADEDAEAAPRPRPADPGELTVEAYDAEEGVVFYDAENPLAWIQTDTVLDLDSLT